MYQQQQNQPDNWRVTTAQSFSVIYFVAQTHALAFTMFTRHTFGSRAFDPHAIFTFAMLFLLAGSFPGFGLYLLLWFVMLLVHRIRLLKQGDVHSQFTGIPWLAMRIPFMRTPEKARRFEPIMCLAAGLMLVGIHPPLGLFVASGFVSLAVVVCIEEHVVKQRLRAIKDAEIEMSFLTDRLRRLR